jgi:hypothetical protein
MVFLEVLHVLLLELLVLLVDLVLLLDHFDDVGDLGLVEDLVHGGVAEVAEDEGEGVEQDDVDVVVAQHFRLGQRLLQLLLDEDVDLVQVLQERRVQVLLYVHDVLEQRLQEAVQTDHTSEYPADPEVLAGNVEEIGIEVLHLEDGVDLVEGDLDDLLVCQFLLHVEEVIHELTDVPDCIGEDGDPFANGDVLRGLADGSVDEEFCRFEDVLVVLGLVEEGEGLVVELDVPVYISAHPYYYYRCLREGSQ